VLDKTFQFDNSDDFKKGAYAAFTIIENMAKPVVEPPTFKRDPDLFPEPPTI